MLAQALGSQLEEVSEELAKTHNTLEEAQRNEQTIKQEMEQLQARSSCSWYHTLPGPPLSVCCFSMYKGY